MEGGELGAKDGEAVGRDAIGTTAIFGRQGLDEALLLEAADGAVESAGAKARAAQDGDVLNHGVAVLRAVGEAGEDEERGIGIMSGRFVYYVTRTTHDVVIAQAGGLWQEHPPPMDFCGRRRICRSSENLSYLQRLQAVIAGTYLICRLCRIVRLTKISPEDAMSAGRDLPYCAL